MIKVVRLECADKQTLGVLKLNDELICYTLENAWVNNQRYVSCIPTGKYQAVRFASNRFGVTFKLLTLDGEEPTPRDGILFHCGNTHVDTTGCILLGRRVGHLKEERAILESKKAFEEFITKMELVDSCECEIMEV